MAGRKILLAVYGLFFVPTILLPFHSEQKWHKSMTCIEQDFIESRVIAMFCGQRENLRSFVKLSLGNRRYLAVSPSGEERRLVYPQF